MKSLRVLLMLALVVTTLSLTGCTGCRKKPVVAPKPPAPIGDLGGPTLTPPAPGMGEDVGLDDKLPPRSGGGFVPVDLGNGKNGRWDDVVYFAFDRSDIGDAERPKLEALAQYLKDNATYCVQIEGHCDERGSDEYNRGLSERRAIAIRDYLVNLGVADTRMETIGYGEEKPAVANAANESDHALNRRGEFVIGTRE